MFMAKNKKLTAVFAALVLALVFCGAACAEIITEFRANVTECDNGTIRKGKVYITREKSRSEWDNSDEIVVTRHDKKVVWFIYPKLKCYVEEPDMGSPANFSKESPSFEVEKPAETAGDLTRKFVGFEMRDSYRMRKYLIKIDYSNIKGSDSYYEWRRDDFPIPVRTESLDGRTYFEYSAIHRGPFDPDLFHEPKNFKKVTHEEFETLMNNYKAKQSETKKN
jgi:hypothetical protein